MASFFALLALPLLLALVVTGVTYALFGLSLTAKRPPRFTRACRGNVAAALARGVGTSLVSQLAMFLTYPLGPVIRARSRTRAAPGEPLVVCLHGLYHNRSAFLAIRPALVRSGLPQVLCLSYRCLGTDFEAEAVRLLATLRQDVSDQTPLLFLGHSLGGLFLRRMLAEPDIGRRTLAAVTLGSPHRGSALAALAIGSLGRSLRPGDPLFASLGALSDPPGVEFLALASPVDNMVIPLDGLDIGRPAWLEETTQPVSHVAMLYHPAVISRAVGFLRRAARTDGRK